MIELGTIRGGSEGAVRDARRKILRVVEDLAGNPLLGSRIASVTSQLFRVADRASGSFRIEVGVDTSQSDPHLVLDLGRRPVHGLRLVADWIDAGAGFSVLATGATSRKLLDRAAEALPKRTRCLRRAPGDPEVVEAIVAFAKRRRRGR